MRDDPSILRLSQTGARKIDEGRGNNPDTGWQTLPNLKLQWSIQKSMTNPRVEPIARVDSLSRADFQTSFVHPLRPVVFRRLAASWPALTKWTPRYFMDHFGDHKVKVYDASFARPGQRYMSNAEVLSFREFLPAILGASRDLRMFLYNIARELPTLVGDLRFPDLADSFSRRFIFMFFGAQSAVTPIHYDIDYSHVFYTSILGRRRITLFPGSQSSRLYRHPFTVRSYVDIGRPDFSRFPELAHARGYAVTLNPGETLFMPSGYWHEVTYEEAGYGVSLRCPSERFTRRLHGYCNLMVVSPIDRMLNKLSSRAWFEWKQRTADRRAARAPR